nr:DUF1540 domain-containing protein [Clostridium sp. N3C]
MMEHNKQAMHNGHNDSIGCIVDECKYHAKNVDYCTLQQIKIVKNERNANSVQATDCGSFEPM